MKRTCLIVCAAALGLLLAGCGGGESTAIPAAGEAVPASATASPEAFSAYVGSLGADDRAEPLELDRVEPPTSETTEPLEVG